MLERYSRKDSDGTLARVLHDHSGRGKSFASLWRLCLRVNGQFHWLTS